MIEKFNEHTPFILIARIKVKPECVEQYLKLAEETDHKVFMNEPGMLHHTFDQHPDNPLCFTWSEVYQNDQAFLDHLSNPDVITYLEKHGELSIDFSVEVYGTVGAVCFERMKNTKLPLKVYHTLFGYSRVNDNLNRCL